MNKDCRRTYSNPYQIAKDTRKEESKASTSSDTHVLMSSEEQFSFKIHCQAKFGRKRKTQDVFQVKTMELKDTLLAICHERADVWLDAVKARILHVHDLKAADAVYHHICSVNFRTNKQIPIVHNFMMNTEKSKKPKLGRSRDDEKTAAFLQVTMKLLYYSYN